MRRSLLVFFLILLSAGAVALSFPPLTGRVVDDAHILSPTTVQNLAQALAAFEQNSTDQVVVATIPSLEGSTIEDYGYQLGRFWGIGQKGKDNGAILLVAPREHKVRIEVGYGLEGALTDALCSEIIQNIILPAFRQGHMEAGVVNGTYAIISALGGKISPVAAQALAAQTQVGSNGDAGNMLPFIFFIVFILLRFFLLPWWFPFFFPLGGGGFGGGGFGGGGGFSGGGGSFGGGGASGGW